MPTTLRGVSCNGQAPGTFSAPEPSNVGQGAFCWRQGQASGIRRGRRRYEMNRTFLISALAAAFLTPGTLAGVTHAAGYVLAVATSGEHGRYLVDPEGRSLYLFEADTQGQGNPQAVSACYEACAEVWPPLIVEAAF